MKRYLCLCCICSLLTLSLWAQDKLSPAPTKSLNQTLSNISITASAATWPFALQDLDKLNLKDLTKITLGEISLNYRVNDRLSFGLGNIANLGNCLAGYFDAEGQFTALHTDDDDDDDIDDESDDNDDNDDDECDDDFLDNLMGILHFNPFSNFPLYLQVAGGYSFGNKAPAYSTKLAYRQALMNKLSISAGIRYSDVLYKVPADAVRISSSNGLRLEIGVHLDW